MKKKVFNIVLLIAAYSFLIYKIVKFNDYAELINIFSSASVNNYFLLSVAVLLFPLNIFFESVKWKFLIKDVYSISLLEAQRQVYYGYLGAFLTPARIGEYPTRSINYKENIITLTVLGYVGSLALMIVMIVFGLTSLPFYLTKSLDINISSLLFYSVSAVILLITIACIFPFISKKLYNKYQKNVFGYLSKFKVKDFIITILYSFLRYLIYVIQFILVLSFCGVNLGIFNILVAVAVYYMFITITPSFSLADPAIRGSWAVIVFSVYSGKAAMAAAVAAVIIWVINTVFPMITGSIISIKKNK